MLTQTLVLAAVVLVPVLTLGTAHRPVFADGIEQGADTAFAATPDSTKTTISQVLFHRGSGRCPRNNPC